MALLTLDFAQNLSHWERRGDVDFLEVNVCSQNGSKCKGSLQVQWQKEGSIGSLVQVVWPKWLWKGGDFSWCYWWWFLAILVRDKCDIWGLIVWNLLGWKSWVCIDHSISELDHSSNGGMSELDNLLQVRIVLESKFITWVHWVKFWHQFLKISLSVHSILTILTNDSWWAEHESFGLWVLQSCIQGIKWVLFIKANNGNSSL